MHISLDKNHPLRTFHFSIELLRCLTNCTVLITHLSIYTYWETYLLCDHFYAENICQRIVVPLNPFIVEKSCPSERHKHCFGGPQIKKTHFWRLRFWVKTQSVLSGSNHAATLAWRNYIRECVWWLRKAFHLAPSFSPEIGSIQVLTAFTP